MRQNLLFAIAIAIATLPLAAATLELDSIQFDPAIIASGDNVDVVVQYHQSGAVNEQTHIGDPAYRYTVSLKSDASLTDDYILIEDATGTDLKGIITAGSYYNTRFRIKVADNAPAGTYGFKLVGQWYRDGVPTDSAEYLRFTMPVKKQGIALSVSNVLSSPEAVHSGDKNVLLTATIINTGEKLAKNVRISLVYPEGFSASYTNNNELGLGSIAAGAEQIVKLYVDTDKALPQGLYNIMYTLTYQDTDNNDYVEYGRFPFVVKKRPYLAVTASEGAGSAGSEIQMKVTVTNQGEEIADSVDVRVLKQSSQPFDMDVRSDYLGRLAPGESATAFFNLHANDDAEIKNHSFSIIIRANGDHAEGDDTVYTYTDAASLSVTGPKPNPYPMVAGILLGILVVIAIVIAIRKPKARR
jgi:hypothetical protein